MRRALPFAAGAAATLVAAVGVSAIAGPGEACAQSGDRVAPRIDCPGGTDPSVTTRAGGACTSTTLLRSASAAPSGRGARVRFTRAAGAGTAPVRVEVFQSASTRRVLGERLVFRADARTSPVTWRGVRQGTRAAPSAGVFFVRVTARRGTRRDVRRFALRRVGSRTRAERAFARRDGCGALRAFKLEHPVFGGASNRAVSVSFRLATTAATTVELRRGGRRVRTLTSGSRRAGVTHRVRLDSERLARGVYEVRLRSGATTASLFVRRV